MFQINKAKRILQELVGAVAPEYYSSSSIKYTYMSLGLAASVPTPSTTCLAEPSTDYGYARKIIGAGGRECDITWSTPVYDSETKKVSITNTKEIHFPEVVNSGWGTVAYFGINTGATVGASDLVYYGKFTANVVIDKVNTIPIIRAGELVIELEAVE